jgi:magnesium-transporting ATPase (P-type)
VRLREVGPNVLAEPRRPSNLRLFAANLVHLFALLLWLGAALAVLGGLPALAVAIVVVVLVNATFAFVQEHRAEKASQALRRVLPNNARVRRDGHELIVPAEALVPGDLLVLEAGDRVGADAEIARRHELRVDNSTLTGESRPVEPADLVHAGTHVTRGRAEAVVVATGMETQFGRIADLTQRAELKPSPLEIELRHVTRLVALVSLGLGSAFFVVAGFLGMGLEERFVFGIGVTVANVPEGLLPTVTLALALATQRMARRNALVRRLSSVETLGETTVICTDKTGTLTENEMTVQQVWTPGAGIFDVEGAGYEPFGRFLQDGRVVDPGPLSELLRCAVLCNDARLMQGASGHQAIGDPTEAALVVLAEKAGLRHEAEAARRPRLKEIPFDSDRKRMTTVHLSDGGEIAYVKGAADVLIPRTTLLAPEQHAALAAARTMERSALRVLAFARRDAPDEADDDIERDLEFLGLVGMLDPPRAEVRDAIASCRAAGIRVIMVTGDSGDTAVAVARAIGLVGDDAHVIGSHELDALDDAELTRRLAEREVVFARISAQQKLRLARVLRASGEIVAMTGDGVNDAPALKEADIGVAMGRTGTDVAREAADMVLLDDNFASIVAAVEEGRAVYDNIRRFASYHFCSNVGELVPFVAWGVSGGAIPLPLTVMQVLAIDLGTDMLPAIALGTERAEPGTMTRSPRPRGERLLSRRVLARVYGFVGAIEGIGAMTSFFLGNVFAGWRPPAGLPDSGTAYLQATTMTQTAIVMGQVGAGQAMRTEQRSVFSLGLLSNRLLLVGIAFELSLALALVYVPGLNGVFHQAPIPWWWWLALVVWAPIVFFAEEARKAVVRRRAP